MSAATMIAVIDDEYALRNLLETSLSARGYTVLTAATAKLGLEQIAARQPQIIVLDLGLPDQDGLEVIRSVREWATTPIIILSARHEEAAKIAALDLGADDYLTKPFSTDELLARIRVAERHLQQRPANEPLIDVGDLRIDLANRSVKRGAEEIHLTPTEYQLLRLFMLNRGRVLTHATLLREVWGPGYQQDTQLLRGFIAQLRQKIEPQPNRPRFISTEPGIGYRMADE